MPVVNPRRIRWMQYGSAEDFSGGPNIRDAPNELAANEVEDAWNVTFDERGGGTSRLGYSKQNGTPFSGGVIQNVYWSPFLNDRITQGGSVIYKGDTNTARHTFSTSALVTFAELNSLVIACHPVDGLFTSPDGITWTVVADADAPVGTCVTVWQNKLFVGRSDGSIHWSAAGDPLTWASTDFNKIWEKDQQPIVAMHIGSGQDILGDAGLLCFKQESTYRVNDSTTGAYTTVDATLGAAGPLAVTGLGPKVICINRHGIYWWADGTVGLTDGTTERFQPLWNSGQLNLSQQAKWCAGRKGTRLVFSLTRAGSTANDLSFEYHADQGWLAPGSNAMSCYASATGASDAVYGGSPTVTGQVYLLDSGGTDDGAPISWRIQTKWFAPTGGFLTSIWQVRAHLRGAGTLTVLKNYETTGGRATTFNTAETAELYDSGLLYDAGLDYELGSTQQERVTFYSIGSCRQVSFIFSGNSSVVLPGQDVLGASGNDVGAFGLFGIEFAYWWLGYQA